MTYVKSIILIIVLLFLITFGVKNNQPTLLNYYFNITTGAIPLYSIVYISIIIGIIIGMIIGVSSRISLSKKVKQVQRENRGLREKIEEGEKKRKKRKRLRERIDDETKIYRSVSFNCPISYHTYPEYPGGNVTVVFLECGYVPDHTDTPCHGNRLCDWIYCCESDR
jgi:uncharacterized integral membrane protein